MLVLAQNPVHCDTEMFVSLFIVVFFFSFISLSLYSLRQMLIWPGSEFIRWPTRLSYAGVCLLRLALNLLQMKFVNNKSFDE